MLYNCYVDELKKKKKEKKNPKVYALDWEKYAALMLQTRE